MAYWGALPPQLGQAKSTKKFSHAYLLSGPEGIGKKTLAAQMAQTILCEEQNAPCGQCKNCLMSKAGTHPDIRYVLREKDKTTLPIKRVREMIEEVYIRPFSANFKVFILPEADKMEPPAQNAILKLLEEPPSYCVIFLLAQNEQSLLPTVRSRAVTVRLPYLSKDLISQKLMEHYPDKKEEIPFLAAFSGGIAGRAIALCEDEDFLTLRATWLDKTEAMAEGKKAAVMEMCTIFEANKEQNHLLFEMLILWLKDALLMSRGTKEGIINQDREQALQDAADTIPPEKLAAAFSYLVKERCAMGRNANIKLWITDVLIHTREVMYD